MSNKQVAIVGAGAVGLLAARMLALHGVSVFVYETSSQAGRKLALCGGGNCNIGPAERAPEDLALRYNTWPESLDKAPRLFHKARGFCHSFSPSTMIEMFANEFFDFNGLSFRGLSIPLRELEGRLYPRDIDAPGLRNRLYEDCQNAGVKFYFDSQIIEIQPSNKGYVLQTVGNVQTFDYCIWAGGSAACPASGASSDPLKALRPFQLPIRKAYPAMGPIYINKHPLKDCAGLVLKTQIKIKAGLNGKVLFTSQINDLLITHKGFSGPLILDLCGLIHEYQALDPLLCIDFMPDLNYDELLLEVQNFQKLHPKKQISSCFQGILPRSLNGSLCTAAAINPEQAADSIGSGTIQHLIEKTMAWDFKVEFPSPWNEAMSWTGGILPQAIDWQTMQVKQQSHFYICGDALALDRPCGGYSLYFAWATAMHAVASILSN